jgi:hypothetical protein
MSIKFYFDIETIPDQADGAFDKYVSAVEPPGQYKKPESIDKWMAENAENVALENYKKTALNGLHGEICSIAWAIADGEIQHLTRMGESETELLAAFWDDVYSQVRTAQAGDESRATWAKLEWIGHNILEFDLRILKQRSMINKVVPLFAIPADARHGQGSVFDTMKEWAGWRGYVKQDELVEAFGLELPQWAAGLEQNDGSHVFDLWRDKEYDKLALYNQLDVWKVRELHKRMTFQ